MDGSTAKHSLRCRTSIYDAKKTLPPYPARSAEVETSPAFQYTRAALTDRDRRNEQTAWVETDHQPS